MTLEDLPKHKQPWLQNKIFDKLLFLIKIKASHTSKDIVKNTHRRSAGWERVFSGKRLVSRACQEHLRINKKTACFKKMIWAGTSCQWAYEKVLSATTYSGEHRRKPTWHAPTHWLKWPKWQRPTMSGAGQCGVTESWVLLEGTRVGSPAKAAWLQPWVHITTGKSASDKAVGKSDSVWPQEHTLL